MRASYAEQNRALLNFQRYCEQLHESFRHNACSSRTFYFTQDDRELFFSRLATVSIPRKRWHTIVATRFMHLSFTICACSSSAC